MSKKGSRPQAYWRSLPIPLRRNGEHETALQHMVDNFVDESTVGAAKGAKVLPP